MSFIDLLDDGVKQFVIVIIIVFEPCVLRTVHVEDDNHLDDD